MPTPKEEKGLTRTPLDVPEPSGLCFDKARNCLWTVGDRNPGLIYGISREGEILQTLSFYGYDMEGIAFRSSDCTLWIVEEQTGNLVGVDTTGQEIERVTLTGVLDGNGGLEGVTYNSLTGGFYLLKEKDPGILIELDRDFHSIQSILIHFAQDFSGADFCSADTILWILSHQDASVFSWRPETGIMEKYGIPAVQAEGIAWVKEDRLFYIVDDSERILYTMTFWE